VDAKPRHPFDRILVPLDGSGLAESALPAAEALGTRLGSVVTLLHVLERRPPESIHGEKHLGASEEAEEYLRQWASRLRAAGVTVETHVHEARERDVSGSIIQHAEEYAQDLVVLSSHGSGGLRDVLFGSIAQQVLQRGTRPILLLHPHADGPAVFAPGRLLVPVHDAHEQDASLCAAATLASAFDSRIDLLWVVPTAATLAGDEAHAGTLLPSTMRALLDIKEEEAKEALARMAAECGAGGAEVVARVDRGDAVREVARYARATKPDLVILSSHGRSGFGALIEGSFAQRLASRVSCPLLLLRAE
jgi:nucleotide-binding universal stress UspA family protein